MINIPLFVHAIAYEDKLLNKLVGKDPRNINATLIFINESNPQKKIYPAFQSLEYLRKDIFIAFNSNLLFYAGYTRNINSSSFFLGDRLIEDMPEKLHQETINRKAKLTAPYASWPKLTANQHSIKIRKDPGHYSDQEFLISRRGEVETSKIKSYSLGFIDDFQAHNEVHVRATIANVESVIINQDQEKNSEAVKLMSALDLKQKIEFKRKMIVASHSLSSPDLTLDYCVNIEILKIVSALQKIVLLKEMLKYNELNQSTKDNKMMRASFLYKAKKMVTHPSSLNQEENYKTWRESQKEKINKTIEEILAEIKDRRELFGIDDNKLKELVEFEESSIVNNESLSKEKNRVKAKIREWREGKEKDPELRKSLMSSVIQELTKKVKIKLYSIKSTPLKLEELPELNEHNIYKDFIIAGMNILNDDNLKEELENFNKTFINCGKSTREQIFFSAVRHGNDKIVKHLLDIELKFHGSEPDCKECFKVAVEFGNVETAGFLLKEKSIRLYEKKDFSCLFNRSIREGHVEMVKFLIENGGILGNEYSNIEVDEVANIERAMNIMKEEEGGNLGRALDFAIKKGSLNLVEYFLEDGVTYDSKNKITCLEFAIQNNQTEVIKILLEKEKSLEGEKYISNLLKLASEKNSHEVIRFLLAKEDGINLSDSPNLDLVHLAIKNGHEEVAKFLLEKEEKNGVQRENYADLFRLAIQNNRIEMAKFFLEKEESRGVLDRDFSGYIKFAIQNNRIEMAKFFLEKEESRGVQRDNHDNLLLFASEKKYTSMCALLIKKGANFSVDFEGRTLLSSIIDGARISSNWSLASNNKEMEILALALNERGGEIKKLDLSKIYPNQPGRQSLKIKHDAISLFNMNVKCFFRAIRLPELEELDLNDNNLDSICIDLVTRMSPKLKKLNLAGNDFFHKGTSSINIIFSKLVAIEDLDLSRNNIDFTKSAKIKGFITWLSNTRTLEKLNLSGNATKNNVEYFCDIIKQNKLTELNISQNKIDEDGIKKIATYLENNSTLKILDLSGNNITPAGLQALYKALEKNDTLQSFGDIEINADIARILERNRQRHISRGGEDLQPASKRSRQSEVGGDGGVARIEVGGGAQIGEGGVGQEKTFLEVVASKPPSSINSGRGGENLQSPAQNQFGEGGVGRKRTFLEVVARKPPSSINSGRGGENLQSPAQNQFNLGPT
jgi:ankyrin repeat protein